mgnify:CR=1 FL=1
MPRHSLPTDAWWTRVLEPLYRQGLNLHRAAYLHGWLPRRPGALPTVVVGNLRVGGTGKTPLARWWAEWLADRGERPAVVVRGHADELTWHRERTPPIPVFADRRRHRALRRAAAWGCTVAVLDDGFQHWPLAPTVALLVVAAEDGAAPGPLLPRGPWREGPEGFARADAILISRKTASVDQARRVADALKERWRRPVALVALRLTITGPRPLAPDEPLAALAGLATPERFVAQLEAAGYRIERAWVRRDHHRYRPTEVAQILRELGDRPLVTTAKDAVKLRRWWPVARPLWVADLAPVPEDGWAAVETIVAHRLALNRADFGPWKSS